MKIHPTNHPSLSILAAAVAALSFLFSPRFAVAASEMIAFTTDRDGDLEVYVMNPNGSQPVNLSMNPSNDGRPAWAPDGTKIAFESDRDGNLNIWIMNADGANLHQITTGPGGSREASWSPDGLQLVFTSNLDGTSEAELYLMDANPMAPITRLTTTGSTEGQPRWSPDGGLILFRRSGGFCCSLWVMNPDTSDQHPLTATDDGGANWSPDGSQIVFHSDVARNGNNQIYVMNRDGTGRSQLTFMGRNSSPSWSPDGTQIVFVSDRDGNPEIYLMNSDGTSQIPLTANSAYDELPVWSVESALPGQELTALGPAEVWIGLKNSDDVGTKFDLLAEVLQNGSPIGSGQLNAVPGGSSGFNNAILRSMNITMPSSAIFAEGDTLSFKLSVRIAVGVKGHRSGTARLWYDDSAANSSFAGTLDGAPVTQFLLNNFALGSSAGPGPKKTIDVFVDRLVGGNPFKPFGTWTTSF